MLGGTSCSKVGGKKISSKSGGDACTRVNGGAKKRGAKKGAKKGAEKGPERKRGGGFCVGNLHPFSTSADSDFAAGAAPEPPLFQEVAPVAETLTGGAKKRKSKKTGKSRKAGPYAKFVKKHFASVQKKNPKFKATDCIKELAKMWKAQKK